MLLGASAAAAVPATLTRRQAFALLREALSQPTTPDGATVTQADVDAIGPVSDDRLEWFGAPGSVAEPVGGIASGDCLRPWVQHADWFLADAGAAPQIGDLVLIESPIPMRAGFGTPARTFYVQSVKQLRRDYRGDLWLTSADGSFPQLGLSRADSHRIVGPVRAVCRWPRPGRELPPLDRLDFPNRVDRQMTEGKRKA